MCVMVEMAASFKSRSLKKAKAGG
ncbi:MAG: hypothetical protein UY05_C0056G0013, partial [Candidatus Peregrinibacteria bacterium GW2011_GWA2_47_7]